MTVPKSNYFTTASSFSGTLFEIEHSITKHFNLEENNRNLQLENIKLRAKVPSFLYELKKDSISVQDTIHQQQYYYIPATIINSTTTKRNNFFTLNAGKTQGISRGMGVFSSNGVVGIVHAASSHFSIVKSVLTSDINIDVMIEKNGAFGLLKWDGKNSNTGEISGITNDIKIPIGSNVISRGGSGIFPKGLRVGKVSAVRPIEGKSVWGIEIRFSEKYASLQNVYVINNLFRNEMLLLENKKGE
ncbi:MAG: rod shape-determining protein MreC [Crocinitomicaceae bacterium]|nr:rod shape-determining protein MreC [Crocinitomicaceae bacterium]